MPTCNVLIIGAGAVGAFYGSRLHRKGHTLVSLVCRSNFAAIKERGVRLQTHSFGDYHFTPAAVFGSVAAAQASGTPWDYVVVTTKALPDRSDDSALIEAVVGQTSAIVLIQNGIGVEAPYRLRFPLVPILSAVTVISAQQPEHGLIVQNRWTRISIGPYVDAETAGARATDGDQRVQDFCRRLAQGGIRDAEPHDEQGIQLIRWHKLLINASMNPASILAGGTGNSRMALDAELREHLSGCMAELWEAVPRIIGRPFPDTLARPDRILASIERNTEGLPSMLLDWRKGSPLELEVILGNPLREARKRGISMPRLHAMYALLKMAQTRRDEDRRESKI